MDLILLTMQAAPSLTHDDAYSKPKEQWFCCGTNKNSKSGGISVWFTAESLFVWDRNKQSWVTTKKVTGFYPYIEFVLYQGTKGWTETHGHKKGVTQKDQC